MAVKKINEMSLSEMGALKNVEEVPSHYAYHPTIKIGEFKGLVKAGLELKVQNLLQGLADVFQKDFQADLGSGVASQENVVTYYRQYFNEIKDFASISSEVQSYFKG